jgi:hypothetical protein
VNKLKEMGASAEEVPEVSEVANRARIVDET